MLSSQFRARFLYATVAVLLATCGVGLSASFPFSEDFESGMGQWTADGTWTATTLKWRSASHAATDSLGTFYTNNTDSSLTLASSLDLSAATTPALRFYHQTALETDYDYGYVDVSTNGGSTWAAVPLASYTGNRGTWTREQLDLSAYAGESDVRIRFHLVTDYSIVKDGWYIDDVLIDEAPQPPTALMATNILTTSLEVRWSASPTPGVTGYRVYRALPGETGRDEDFLYAEISGGTTTSFMDYAVSPKTAYHYWIAAHGPSGLYGSSPILEVSTPSGMDYPFHDTGEGGPGTWNADAPWALSEDDAVSPTHAWSDSPGTNYGNLVNASLTLVAPLDLTVAARPVIQFTHRHAFVSGDSGNIEVSPNGGMDWDSLGRAIGSSDGWQRGRYSLAAYTNSNNALVRFRVTSDAANTLDGWIIDDIAVSDAPDTVNAPVLSNIQSHSVRLTWGPVTNDFFSHYAIHRLTSAGVTINAPLAATISNRVATTYTDTGLALDTTYYYRVFAVSRFGVYSDAGTESSAHTLNHPVPFTEDFEGSLNGWNITGDWGTDTNNPHGGVRSLADSPNTGYLASTTAEALTAVDLRGTTWPILRFWDRFDLGTYDSLGLEVSPNGATWTRLYGMREGSRTDWREQIVDLSPWKGEPNVRIRFWRTSNADASVGDGWFIDDVAVEENTPAAVAYPYYDDFEEGFSNWLHSGWAVVTNEAHDGTASLRASDTETVAEDYVWTYNQLELAASLDLAGAVNPQLTFWIKTTMAGDSYFRLFVSANDGVSWTERNEVRVGSTTGWTRSQCDLTGYAGQTIRVRLSAEGYRRSISRIWLDDLAIEDRTPDTLLHGPVPHLKSVDLSWDASTLGSAFKRYDLYRDINPTVTLGDHPVGSFTDVNTTNLTDTGLSIGQTYYYRLFVVNTNDTYSLGSERQITTVPLLIGFTDPMDNLDLWDATGTWGPDGSSYHSSSNCLSDSPGGLYQPGTSGQILTAVDLRETDWPVLRFWDRFELGTYDSLGLEVSPNGSTWTRLYGMREGSRTDWREQIVDLSPWKGQPNVRIRFWRASDTGASIGDGWFLDDLSVEEYTPAAVAYPYYDDFEEGFSNWLHAGWSVVTNEAHDGTASLRASDTETVAEDYVWTYNQLELAASLDLAGAVNPQLTFWIKTTMAGDSYFRLFVSANDGVSWTERNEVRVGSTTGWTRSQSDLSGYAGQTIRVRLSAEGYRRSISRIWIDALAIEERTPDALLHGPVPHLKSVDLSWDTSTLGPAFKRYELYRDISPTVTLSDRLIGSFTDVNTTNLTDTGLSIGQTYYYRLFVVNTNDTYSLGSERQITTVPLAIGFTDPMDNLDLWDATGAWGPDGSSYHSSSNCLSDSPGGLYQPGTSGQILTAVDLRETDWPVLRFWDRFELGTYDSLGLEVSPNGSTWTRLYGMREGSRTDWREQIVDLSPWKGQPNVRIRFWRASDTGASIGDGWFLDDVSVEDHTHAPVSYPYYDSFENGFSNWLHSGWAVVTNEAYDGATSLRASDTETVAEDYVWTYNQLELAASLDLAGAVNPQLTFWIKTTMAGDSYFRLFVSANDGVSWTERNEVRVGSTIGWTRSQCDLTGYAGQTIRVRLSAEGYRRSISRIWVDDLAIEDRTTDALLHGPVPHLKTVDLSWDASTLGSAFKRYELYRDIYPTVTLGDDLIGSFTDVNTTNLTDTGLSIGQTYYYRLFVVNINDTYSLGSERQITTVPITVGFTDPMESLDQWNATGTWGSDNSAHHSGSNSISCSPGGLYQPGTSGDIRTAVDLRDTSWPVLRFWDRFELGTYDSLGLEVSPNGTTWTRLYGMREGSRTDWREQIVDLSPWKGQPNVRIRFWRASDTGASIGDGWFIDDVTVEDLTPAAISYPYYDSFEHGLSNWLHSGWAVVTNEAHIGTASLRASDTETIAEDYVWTYNQLELAAPMVLTGAVNPKLTFWMKTTMAGDSYFRLFVSANDGVSWTERSEVRTGSTIGWTRIQCDLTGYIGQSIRVRLNAEGYRRSISRIWIDGFGVGEPTPGAPMLHSPAQFESVAVVRPALQVHNAEDYQSDALNYEFEVYSDETFSNLVTTVPGVAQGVDTTTWVVDHDLPDGGTFWWRCRAADAGGPGPWMATATFYVNHINSAPYPITIAGPPSASILHDRTYPLSWQPTTDPDNGDYVVAYHVEAARSTNFASPVISDTNIVPPLAKNGAVWAMSVPLADMDGNAGLLDNTIYYWRVRARDNWDLYGDWSTNHIWFIFGTPPPTVRKAAMPGDGTMSFEYDRSGKSVVVEFSPSLTEPDWNPISDSVDGTNVTFDIPDGESQGFFRVKTE